MATKSATVMSCIELELKKEAEEMPKAVKADHEMTATELNEKLEIGLAQVENGEGIPAKNVASEMRRMFPK